LAISLIYFLYLLSILMSSSWVSTFAPIQSSSGPQSQYNNTSSIDDLFTINSNEDTKKLLDIKMNIIDLIQKKDEINLINHDKEYKNDKIKILIDDIKDKIKEFNKKQEELNSITKDVQEELDNIKGNISSIDNMIDYIKKLPEDYKEDDLSKQIFENMTKLSQNIFKNQKITELKKKYVEKYEEIEEYIHLIRELNNFNTSNICPLCFTDQVDHFLNPCGHTFCKSCLKNAFRQDDDGLLRIGRDIHVHCPMCRSAVQKINQLYFL
jgi:uncharacterized protein with von Willebrand factor type A (vWA) domain